jgi:hypothetical protein
MPQRAGGVVDLIPRESMETPLGAVVRGAAAGLAATLLLSVLARAAPGLWNEQQTSEDAKALPDDSFDPVAVEEWSSRAQSPAAHSSRRGPGAGPEPEGPPGITPAGALLRPQAPGPEGLAEQFAFKVAAGVFGRDISGHVRPFGLATHLLYGSAWGALYGLVRASCRVPRSAAGPFFGLLVYGIGPGVLVPAMKIMGKPSEEPPKRTAMLVAEAFAALARQDDGS